MCFSNSLRWGIFVTLFLRVKEGKLIFLFGDTSSLCKWCDRLRLRGRGYALDVTEWSLIEVSKCLSSVLVSLSYVVILRRVRVPFYCKSLDIFIIFNRLNEFKRGDQIRVIRGKKSCYSRGSPQKHLGTSSIVPSLTQAYPRYLSFQSQPVHHPSRVSSFFLAKGPGPLFWGVWIWTSSQYPLYQTISDHFKIVRQRVDGIRLA